MAHVHYQFITQPSATFPLRPHSRFPSFLGSSTPSFLLLAIRSTVGGDGGGESKRDGEEDRVRGEERTTRRTREKERNESKRPWPAQRSDGQFGAIGSRFLQCLTASGAFTFLPSPSLRQSSRACYECNLLHARATVACTCNSRRRWMSI